MKYLIITKKIWNKENFLKLDKSFHLQKNISIKRIDKIKPKIIFFIHWSKKIPSSIYRRFFCIQFHCSSLPKFRGGSPVQNQILKGIKKTKLTAFKIDNKIDTGEICLIKSLSLNGRASEIYSRIERISIKMIIKLSLMKKIIFKPQKGRSSFFKRRLPSESKISLKEFNNTKKLYDFLRMLDAPDYPNAFLEFKKFKFVFNDVKFNSKKIKAKVQIFKNEK